MRRRWLVLIGFTTALVLVAAAGVRALNQYQEKPLNRQNLGIIRSSTTSSTSWTDVPGWGFSDGPTIRARGGLAVTLSVTVSGARVRFRVAIEDVANNFRVSFMTPRSAVFDPGDAGAGSFSYTFVKSLPRGRYTVNLYWRSPTGAPVTLSAGSVVLQYASAT